MTALALEREALLRAILESPADDARRLVYADWLEEHGRGADGERAEFIRLGIANPGEQPHNTFGPVGLREETLIYRHYPSWLGGLPGLFGLTKPYADHGYCGVSGGVGWGWSRGFVSSIRAGWRAVWDCHAALWEAQPIESVCVADREPFASLRLPGMHGWFLTDDSMPDAEDLPPGWWNLLPGPPDDLVKKWKYWPSREAAHEALSAAIVKWAVGLRSARWRRQAKASRGRARG